MNVVVLVAWNYEIDINANATLARSIRDRHACCWTRQGCTTHSSARPSASLAGWLRTTHNVACIMATILRMKLSSVQLCILEATPYVKTTLAGYRGKRGRCPLAGPGPEIRP